MGKLIDYIFSRRRVLALIALFGFVFFVVLELSGVDMAASVYAFELCGALGICVFAYDLRRFSQKRTVLKNIAANLDAAEHDLPEATNDIERDYNNIIAALIEDERNRKSTADVNYREMVDYFTLWAHQIKTPIAAMQLLLSSNDEKNRSDEMNEQLFRIEQYAQMVLQYIRTSEGGNDYVFAECSLDDIIRASVRRFAPTFIRKRLSLNYEPCGVRIVTDEKWLGFIIEQFLSNALKYTQTGSVSIYIAKNRPNCLVIEDTGIGIQPEDLPRIFEKGFTGYNGRSNRKSTGIGLYLASIIAHRLGISLSIESEPEHGTRVFVDMSRKGGLIE